MSPTLCIPIPLLTACLCLSSHLPFLGPHFWRCPSWASCLTLLLPCLLSPSPLATLLSPTLPTFLMPTLPSCPALNSPAVLHSPCLAPPSSHPAHTGPPSQQMDMARSLSDSGRLELVHSQVWISASPLPYSLLTSCLAMSSCPTLVLSHCLILVLSTPHAHPSCSSRPSLLTCVLACSFSHPPSLPSPHACPSHSSLS
jgi:hypothetical protein